MSAPSQKEVFKLSFYKEKVPESYMYKNQRVEELSILHKEIQNVVTELPRNLRIGIALETRGKSCR